MVTSIEHVRRGLAQQDRNAYLPTPEQIAAECEKIRETWPEYKEAECNQLPAEPWEISQVGTTTRGDVRRKGEV